MEQRLPPPGQSNSERHQRDREPIRRRTSHGIHNNPDRLGDELCNRVCALNVDTLVVNCDSKPSEQFPIGTIAELQSRRQRSIRHRGIGGKRCLRPISPGHQPRRIHREICGGERSRRQRDVPCVNTGSEYPFQTLVRRLHLPASTVPGVGRNDHGRDRWHDLLTRDDVAVTDDGDRLVMSFPESMSTEMYTYMRDPPTEVRVEKRGRDIIIKTPEEFDEWLGEPPTGIQRSGILDRARSLFG